MNLKLLIPACALVLAACKPAATPETAAPAAEPAAPETATVLTHWQCGDARVSATFDNAAGNVSLSFDGESLVLPQAVSASGARYADDQGNEFWNKGDTSTFTVAGQDAVECAVSERGSPWDEAQARGATFRAVGNEPGWLVEVGSGETPALQASLDFGSTQIDIAAAQPTETGYAGTAEDGTTVTLTIADEACADTMSGAEFPASATLVVGDRSFQGCGRRFGE